MSKNKNLDKVMELHREYRDEIKRYLIGNNLTEIDFLKPVPFPMVDPTTTENIVMVDVHGEVIILNEELGESSSLHINDLSIYELAMMWDIISDGKTIQKH